MLEEIKKIERRMFRHGYEDGIFEIVFGIAGILIGLFFLGYFFIPEKPIYRLALFFLIFLVMLFVAFLIKNMARSLKEKLTWPRTGFVAYQEGKKRRLKAGIRGGLLGFCFPFLAGLTQDLFSANHGFYSYPAVFGFVMTALFFWITFRSGLIRFAILGGIFAAIGLFLSLTGWKHMLSMSAFLGSFGILLLASGLIASRMFLRRNPLPAEDHQ